MPLIDDKLGKKIIAASNIGLWVVEMEEGKATRFFADSVMDELLGIPADVTPEQRYELHHKNIHPADIEMFEDYAEKLTESRTEVVYRYVHPTRGEMFVRCSGFRNLDEKRWIQLTGTHQDISDIIRFERDKYAETRLAEVVAEKEAALVKAKQASIAKSEFLSRMSHDIRTPLNGIIGIMDINEKHADDLELVAENRKKARVAAEHLLSLLNDILDMSKFENDRIELAREPMNLLKEFSDVLTIINLRASEKGVTVVHDGGKDIQYPDVFGSKVHFKRVMMNILTNCVKYNKPNGKIIGHTIMESCSAQQVMYRFEITDTGIGMSEEFLEHIFEPFTQEKNDARSRYQGTGMGMAIVKKLTEKMGGSIEVESTLGIGSKFIIRLPFERNYYSDAEVQEIAINDSVFKGKNILLVEDNELNADIAKYILEDLGMNVTLAENGQKAVDIFMAERAGTFDIILMDIMMPILDGYSATEKIRRSMKKDAYSIPIIALSANAFSEDVNKAKAYGMNDHLAKPLNVKALKKTLGRFLSK